MAPTPCPVTGAALHRTSYIPLVRCCSPHPSTVSSGVLPPQGPLSVVTGVSDAPGGPWCPLHPAPDAHSARSAASSHLDSGPVPSSGAQTPPCAPPAPVTESWCPSSGFMWGLGAGESLGLLAAPCPWHLMQGGLSPWHLHHRTTPQGPMYQGAPHPMVEPRVPLAAPPICFLCDQGARASWSPHTGCWASRTLGRGIPASRGCSWCCGGGVMCGCGI